MFGYAWEDGEKASCRRCTTLQRGVRGSCWRNKQHRCGVSLSTVSSSTSAPASIKERINRPRLVHGWGSVKDGPNSTVCGTHLRLVLNERVVKIPHCRQPQLRGEDVHLLSVWGIKAKAGVSKSRKEASASASLPIQLFFEAAFLPI